jgi:hypothetical protein
MACVRGNVAPAPAGSGVVFVLVTLAVVGPLRAQVPGDSSVRLPSQLLSAVAALPPAAQLRVATRLGTFTGRVASRSDDALTVTVRNSAQARTVALSDVHTLWVAARTHHAGALAGAGVGALFAGLLAASPDGDDPGLNTVLAAGALVGGVLLGLVIDSAVERWTRTYP